MRGAAGGVRTLVVGQSGGATPVINASLAGVVEEAQRCGVEHILGLAFGLRGLLAGQFFDLTAATPEEIDLLAATPSAALGACRYQLSPERLAPALAMLERWRVDAFLYIGGNDSAETALSLARASGTAGLSLRCLAIPKTIDNDLPAMDHTPGYGSAARLIASLSCDLGLDAWAMQHEEQVRILEVYGRDTGWLAAASVLGRLADDGTPHLVLVPERPFAEDAFLTAVERQVARQRYCTIVVGEMLRDARGALVGAEEQGNPDAFGHAETRRPGAYLRELIQRRLHLRAKDDRPGSLQKVVGELASTLDREEARELGRAAVRASAAGHSERIVTLQRVNDEPYQSSISLVSLAAVAGQVRPLPPEFLDAEGQPSAAFRRYARPLLGAALPRRARLTASAAQPTGDHVP